MQESNTVAVWHPILWSNYKARVFSNLYSLARLRGYEYKFVQIAESESARTGLGSPNLAEHQYPYQLLFKGFRERIPKLILYAKVLRVALLSDDELTLIYGFGEIECWIVLLGVLIRRKKIAVVIDGTLRDTPFAWWKYFLKRVFVSLCDGCLCYGERSSQYAVSLGMSPHRIQIRCQAPALGQDYVPEKALLKRRTREFDNTPPVYLFVGRLVRSKRIDVLIRAFFEIQKDYPGATLRVIGVGEELEPMVELVEDLSISGSVHFLGAKFGDDLWEEYSASNCLILPSLSEPWGLTANEALSFGCPVIASEQCGCVPELIIEGLTGSVMRLDDKDHLVSLMKIYAGNNINYSEACIAVAEKFTAQRSAEEMFYGLQAIGDL